MTVKIADAEPIVFNIDASEEAVLRKAAYSVNERWRKWRAEEPGKSSHYILAKVAFAFADLAFHKSEQLEKLSNTLDNLEHDLDDILLKIEN